MRTPSQQLADLLLGEPVEDWIARQREAGVSWRQVALNLRDATDGKVDITPTTSLTWLSEAEEAEASA